jgi:hypothetical protein
MEHIRSIQFNKNDSGYATHLLRSSHCYGKIKKFVDKTDRAKKNFYIFSYMSNKNKLSGFRPQANYTDRAAAACLGC